MPNSFKFHTLITVYILQNVCLLLYCDISRVHILQPNAMLSQLSQAVYFKGRKKV